MSASCRWCSTRAGPCRGDGRPGRAPLGLLRLAGCPGVSGAVLLLVDPADGVCPLSASDARARWFWEAQQRAGVGPLPGAVRTWRPTLTSDLTRIGHPAVAAAATESWSSSLVLPFDVDGDRLGGAAVARRGASAGGGRTRRGSALEPSAPRRASRHRRRHRARRSDRARPGVAVHVHPAAAAGARACARRSCRPARPRLRREPAAADERDHRYELRNISTAWCSTWGRASSTPS